MILQESNASCYSKKKNSRRKWQLSREMLKPDSIK